MAVDFLCDLQKGMDMLHKRGAFLTVSDKEKVNTMTISWGSVGFMWRKPVFMTLVRDSRFSNEILKNGMEFTISIPYDDSMKEALKVCGTLSGRDANKCKEANIEFIHSKDIKTPIVDGCNLYYECKVVYFEKLNKDNMQSDMFDTFYGDLDLHNMYYAEIVNCYKK